MEYHHMAKTYAQIEKQIEVLKQQAAALRKKESAGVIARIREAIEFYQLTAEDLGLGGKRGPRKQVAASSTSAGQRKGAARKRAGKRPSVIRYRDGAGHSWTGMGRKPGWLNDGLAAGKTLADFAVAPAAGSGMSV